MSDFIVIVVTVLVVLGTFAIGNYAGISDAANACLEDPIPKWWERELIDAQARKAKRELK